MFIKCAGEVQQIFINLRKVHGHFLQPIVEITASANRKTQPLDVATSLGQPLSRVFQVVLLHHGEGEMLDAAAFPVNVALVVPSDVLHADQPWLGVLARRDGRVKPLERSDPPGGEMVVDGRLHQGQMKRFQVVPIASVLENFDALLRQAGSDFCRCAHARRREPRCGRNSLARSC